MTDNAAFPRAGIDPIRDPATALAVIEAARRSPPAPETIVLMLDARRCGVCITVVSGTQRADDALDVVAHLAPVAAASGVVDSIVVASVRPNDAEPERRDDPDRWMDMSGEASLAGLRLIEWFVLGDTVRCPRALLGDRPRWTAA